MLRRRIWRGGFGGGLEVHLDDEVVLVRLLFLVCAGIHVRWRRGASVFFNDNFSPARQRHAALEGLLNLTLDVEALEDGDVFLEDGDFPHAALGTHARPIRSMRWPSASSSISITVDGLGEEVAHGALDNVGLRVEAGGLLGAVEALLDLPPLVEEDGEIAHE